ncbi:uncharacterized protein VP01_211g2 [Puccinia sorghi]|uniref:Uncharacterized protein n=1 Tax=Puccinia sorghi TaxID=27349 RepID=A0A0L6VBT8_9BASI|nr:uncharacterized protein VP01_211g2 [Puccinia sorghi]
MSTTHERQAGPSEAAEKDGQQNPTAGLDGGKTTTTVRHRLPKRKVNTVWKPMSTQSCELVQASLARAMHSHASRLDYPSLRRIQRLAAKLAPHIRVPVGVYSGLKSDSTAEKIDLPSLDSLKNRNAHLLRLILHRQKAVAKLQKQLASSL